jgi:hypothetical protein
MAAEDWPEADFTIGILSWGEGSIKARSNFTVTDELKDRLVTFEKGKSEKHELDGAHSAGF